MYTVFILPRKSLNKTIFFKLESGLNSLYPLKLNNIDPPYLASILTSFLVIVSHCSLIFLPNWRLGFFAVSDRNHWINFLFQTSDQAFKSDIEA